MAIDGQGNMVVVGTFSAGNVDFGGGALNGDADGNVFVAKFDALGNHIWSKAAGSAGFQGASAVALDSQDNIVVVGTFRSQLNFGSTNLDNAGTQFADIYVAKLDSSGTEIWAKRFGDGVANADTGNAVAVDPLDNVLITGQFQDTITFGSQQLTAASGGDGFSLFVAKFSPAGDHVFSKAFGDASTQSGLAIAAAVDGSIAVGGFSNGAIDFGNGAKPNAGGQRGFVAKLSSTGDETYAELFAGSGAAGVSAVAFDGAGNLFFCGSFKSKIMVKDVELEAASGSDEVFVGQFDTNGNPVYAVRFGDAGLDQAADLVVDGAGYAHVGGKYGAKLRVNSMSTLEATDLFDGFLLRVAPDGHGFWGVSIAGDQVQQVAGIALTPSGQLVAVGSFFGNVVLGSQTETAQANQDMFLVKYGR